VAKSSGYQALANTSAKLEEEAKLMQNNRLKRDILHRTSPGTRGVRQHKQRIRNIYRITSWREAEKQLILSAVKKLDGDLFLVAHLLGIGKTTLYRKLKAYGWKRKRGWTAAGGKRGSF
jgi:DNA-binding NtrC family response regulator